MMSETSDFPINGLWPINYDGQRYVAPDGSEWLRTGITAVDIDGSYPDATSVADYKFVPTSYYTGDRFNIYNTIATNQGICWDGANFWITDYLYDYVYKFDRSGVYTGFRFKISVSGISAIYGLCWDGTSLWVSCRGTGKIIAFNRDGTETGNSFNYTDITSDLVWDITWDGSNFWLVNLSGDIYKYDSSGNYTGFSFSASADFPDSKILGLEWVGDGILLADYDNNKIYKYDTTGSYTGVNFSVSGQMSQPLSISWDGGNHIWIKNLYWAYKYKQAAAPSKSFDVSAQGTNTQGICWDGDSFWVVDADSSYIYKYDAEGVYAGDSFYVGDQDVGAIGVTWDGTYFWVAGYAEDNVYQYDADGIYIGQWPSSIISTVSEDSPTDLVVVGDYIWVLGNNKDTVYKFEKSGIYTGTSFSVSSQDTNPQGICWDGNSFWVAGITTKKVYKYDGSGNYTGISFSTLGQEPLPTGITYDGNNLWVTGKSNKVYQYLPENLIGVETAGTKNGAPTYTRIK